MRATLYTLMHLAHPDLSAISRTATGRAPIQHCSDVTMRHTCHRVCQARACTLQSRSAAVIPTHAITAPSSFAELAVLYINCPSFVRMPRVCAHAIRVALVERLAYENAKYNPLATIQQLTQRAACSTRSAQLRTPNIILWQQYSSLHSEQLARYAPRSSTSR